MKIRFRFLDGSGDSLKEYDLGAAGVEADRLLRRGFLGFDVPSGQQITSGKQITPESDVIWSGTQPIIG